jgi:hypothetical protein
LIGFIVAEAKISQCIWISSNAPDNYIIIFAGGVILSGINRVTIDSLVEIIVGTRVLAWAAKLDRPVRPGLIDIIPSIDLSLSLAPPEQRQFLGTDLLSPGIGSVYDDREGIESDR